MMRARDIDRIRERNNPQELYYYMMRANFNTMTWNDKGELVASPDREYYLLLGDYFEYLLRHSRD